MKLFSKKQSPPPSTPPAAPPTLPTVSKPKTETILKLSLPDVFAFEKDATRSIPVSRVREETKSKTSRGVIVLVESNEEIRRLLSRLLQHEGYLLLTTTCLAEAREILKERTADFVLARRACVPLNLETDIALRDLRQKAHVRIVDDFTDLILGQVVDYESMAQCTLALSGLLLSLLEGTHANARGHAQTVAKYSRMIAQRLGMNRRDLDALTLAAYLHDLGSIEADQRISEPTFANNQPFLSPSLRPTLDLIANIPFAYPVNNLLTATTEHTPSGTEFDDALIPPSPLGARILRIVDTYDTLRRNHTEEFSDESKVFDWMRRQPTGIFDTDALETLIHIRKNERAINAMRLFQEAVLIVDPHFEELHVLKLRLQNDDHQVLTVRSISEALDQLRAQPISLILASYIFPDDTTAFDLLRTIKNDRAFRDIPLIVHAPSNTDLIKQSLELGAEDWYPRPQNIEIIALKIGRILNRIRTRPTTTEGVHGNLHDMGLIEMIQILCAGKRSITIQLERPNLNADLIIHNGQIINAHLQQQEAEPAAIEILTWTDGNFCIRPLHEVPPAKITSTTDSLILEAWILQDQRRNQAAQPAPQPA